MIFTYSLELLDLDYDILASKLNFLCNSRKSSEEFSSRSGRGDSFDSFLGKRDLSFLSQYDEVVHKR